MGFAAKGLGVTHHRQSFRSSTARHLIFGWAASLVANRLVRRAWELDFHRLPIDRVREKQFSLIEPR
jgi:hypothetical protein